LDLNLLANRIGEAAALIDAGRKCFTIDGKEHEGRILYEDGIERAMIAFQDAQKSADPQTIILAEYAFLTQEFQLCNKSDKDSIDSLTKALISFDDAFLALQAVEGSYYKVADLVIPHYGKHRVNSFPKDAFHIACESHKTRLQNILRTPGLNLIEKELLKHAQVKAPRSGVDHKCHTARAQVNATVCK
jgi:hypothetical protein